MDRVLEHEAGDLTCTVEAGIRLSALAAALAPAGQRLSLDPPGDPTIGACLAGNLSGPLRHRFGAPRDLVLGVTLVLADGTIVNAGGKVVKNVAGYDLGKLVCGSRGRLAFIGRVSLRLHPAPVAAATVVVETDDPASVAAALLDSQLVPSALDVLQPGRVAVLFEGGAAAVAAQVEATRALVGGVEADASVWAESRARQAAALGRSVVRAGGDCGPSSPSMPEASSARPPGIAYLPDAVPDETPESGAAPPGAGARALRPATGARMSAAPDVLRSLTSDCVHCGFCLPTCPTYLLWSEEMDSPRGRIQLMESNLDGTISLNPTVDRALRRLPRLHGVRHGLPLRRPVRPADRGDARDDRDRDPTPVRRPVRARGALQAPPLPAADGAGAAARAARPQAAAAGPPRRDDRDRAAVALDREARTSYARGWRDPRACRHSHRLRAVGGVRLGQRGYGAGARGRRLRGRRAAAGLLRRALDARRTRRRGTRVRAPGDRGVRGRRDGDRQHLRLRLAPEGARARAR